jgi:hypothetical protein
VAYFVLITVNDNMVMRFVPVVAIKKLIKLIVTHTIFLYHMNGQCICDSLTLKLDEREMGVM